MTPDILTNPHLPQASVIIMGTITFALLAWLPQPEPAKAECAKPLYLPTAEDAASYSWAWPLQETETSDPRQRRRHKRG